MGDLSENERCSENLYNSFKEFVGAIWLIFCFLSFTIYGNHDYDMLFLLIGFATCLFLTMSPFFIKKSKIKLSKHYCFRIRKLSNIKIDFIWRSALSSGYALIIYFILNPNEVKPDNQFVIFITIFLCVALAVMLAMMFARSHEKNS